jgi:hypothetical protein
MVTVVCDNCGIEFRRKASVVRQNKRHFHSCECWRMYQKAHASQTWSATHNRSRRQYIKTHRINGRTTCENCGIVYPTRKIEIHHRDSNWRNNDIDNLIGLCFPCHWGIPKHKAKNYHYNHAGEK